MKKYAYLTYIDKKEYLPGLQGLYYSLQKVKTKYDLIIIYSGEIEKVDILNYVEEKQIILEKIPNYIVSPGIKTDMINSNIFDSEDGPGRMIYFSWQNSNIIGPFYGFKFTQYEEIMYIHCDIIVLKNIDEYFYNFNKIGIYVSDFEKYDGDTKEYVHSTHNIFFKPDIFIFNLIMNNIDNILLNRWITNIDSFINIFFIDNNYLPIYNIPNEEWLDQKIFHSSGILKYWTLFPNIKIKEIIENKNLEEITCIMKSKIINTDKKLLNDQIPLSIWKNNNQLINDFRNKCPMNLKEKMKWKL